MADRADARRVLYALIKESPYTFKHVAEQIGERPDTLSSRLGERQPIGYQNIDIDLILAILGVIGVSFTRYAQRVELVAGGADNTVVTLADFSARDIAAEMLRRAEEADHG